MGDAEVLQETPQLPEAGRASPDDHCAEYIERLN